MEELFIKNTDIFGERSEEAMSGFSVTFICILLICFLLMSATTVAGQLASSLVGGKADAKFQKKLKVVLQTVVGWLTGGISRGITRFANMGKAGSKK